MYIYIDDDNDDDYDEYIYIYNGTILLHWSIVNQLTALCVRCDHMTMSVTVVSVNYVLRGKEGYGLRKDLSPHTP